MGKNNETKRGFTPKSVIASIEVAPMRVIVLLHTRLPLTHLPADDIACSRIEKL
jgi:hypothetical protein